METPIKIFGARACIRMRYAGGLHALAAKLSSGLMLPDFDIGARESPPYDEMGTLEVMGCELWLQRTKTTEYFQYQLRMETAHSLEESFSNQMYDLSPWLARYISSICEIEALVSDVRNQGDNQNASG